jgi:hypothetical protein
VGNYEQSSGCRAEITLAEKLRIPVYYSFSELVIWAQKRER